MNYRKGWTSKLFGIEKKGSRFKVRRYYCGNVTGYDYLDSGAEFVVDAIAWMPLPEPYKE